MSLRRVGWTLALAVLVAFVPLASGSAQPNAGSLLQGVTAISAGDYYTLARADAPLPACAIVSGGGVVCWAPNGTPADVPGLASSVTAIAAGTDHSCVITSAGGVKCWGNNAYGQLGDGTTHSSSTPVDVTGLSSGVTAIAAGTFRTCALLGDGGVKCWGYYNHTPTDVPTLARGVSAVSVGAFFGCVKTSVGGAKCWGLNDHGQLGDGTDIDSSTPVNVSGLASGVGSISAGSPAGAHTCAVTTAGGAKCWGLNSTGQLGDGTTAERSTPVDVAGLSSGVGSIDAGVRHTCAVTSSGGAKCWGDNRYGELGDGTTTSSTTPVDVSALSSGVKSIAAGFDNTCALLSDSRVKCWGLGKPTPTDVPAARLPETPTITGSDPASPSNDNHPKIKGSAAVSSTVGLYKGSSCSGAPLAQGTAAAFASGFTVSVPDNSRTSFTATVHGWGSTSACSKAFTYVERSPAKKLIGRVGPGLTISLRKPSGKLVRRLKAGRYRITVRDRSKIRNFHLYGPAVNKKTGVRFVGKKVWRVRFEKRKTYRYRSDVDRTILHRKFKTF